MINYKKSYLLWNRKCYTWRQDPWQSTFPILFLRTEMEEIHKQLCVPLVKIDYYAQPVICAYVLGLSGLNRVLFTRK